MDAGAVLNPVPPERVKLTETIDQLATEGRTAAIRAVGRLLQFCVALLEQAGADSVLIRASGLAYSSLLALVPLTVVLFAVFTAFGALDELRDKVQEFLLDQILPTSHAQVSEYLDQFTANAGELGFLGSLFLLATSIFLLEGIESNFNDIWHVANRRSLVSRATAYTSALIFGSLLLGASLSVTARIKATLFTGIPVDPTFLNRLFNVALPLALSILGIFALSLIVPDTRVRVRGALIGAVVSGILFELGKHLFAVYAGRSVQYSTIYGSLALFPLFLVWLYITWVIVLLGVEMAYVHQNLRMLIRSRQLRSQGGDGRVILAVEFFLELARRYDQGRPAPSVLDLGERFLVPHERARLVVRQLVEGELAHFLGDENGGLVPSRPLDRLTISDVISASVGGVSDLGHPPESIEQVAAALLDRFLAGGFAAVGSHTVAELVRGPEAAAPTELPLDGFSEAELRFP
jgi:membrane protein